MLNFSTADPARLGEFFESASVGIIVFDVSDNNALTLVCCNNIYRNMHSIHHELETGIITHDFLPDCVHKDYQKYFQDCRSFGKTVDYESPLYISGKESWSRTRMVPVFGESTNKIARVFVTHVDITKQKQLEDKLNTVRSRLEATIDSTYDAIITIDNEYKITTFNQAAQRLFGYKRNEIEGKSLNVLLPKNARKDHAKQINEFGESPEQSRPMESRVEVAGLRSDGTTFPAEVAIAKIEVHDKKEYTAVIRDISVQVRLLDELRMRATTDPLTGISNRRHLIEVAEIEIERSERYDHPLSIIMLDVDDFKSINDTYGHVIGDAVLKEIGKTLKKGSRKLDIPARWGGEEFCLLIPESAPNDAQIVAHRLLENIRTVHTKIPKLGGRVVTVSIGLAFYNKGDGDIDQFVNQADKAMYKAKNTGKDKICIAPEVG